MLYGLEKLMYARAISKPAGSEARGEGRERGNLKVTTSQPLVGQRAGGIREYGFRTSGTFVASLSGVRCRLCKVNSPSLK